MPPMPPTIPPMTTLETPFLDEDDELPPEPSDAELPALVDTELLFVVADAETPPAAIAELPVGDEVATVPVIWVNYICELVFPSSLLVMSIPKDNGVSSKEGALEKTGELRMKG